MKFKVSVFLLFSSLMSYSYASTPSNDERILYAASDSTEAVMTFSNQVEIGSNTEPTSEKVSEKIDAQLTHLFGPMGFARFKAVPKGDQVLSAITVAKGSTAPATYIASYHYRGTIVLQKGPDSEYDVTLPINPDKIYAASMVMRGSKKTYPCTDDHYDTEGDFWYFWNPENRGCQLKEGVDYTIVKTKIERKTNTVRTYPEYDRLVQKRGNQNVIYVSLILGMDEATHGKNPMTSNDINATNYREMRKALVVMGFKTAAPWTSAQIQKITTKTVSPMPYVEELSKETPKGTMIVRMFFGPTGIDEKSTAFHYFLKDTLENSSVFAYDGHSGLGGHLDLSSIEDTEGFKFAPSKSQYQIYYFNSCTSYTYYNTMYFGRKQSSSDPKGTKNLDIMTNGLATLFGVMHDTNMALVKAVDAWAESKARISYQDLAKEIDSDNLFGINGDEDNSN